jgi:hypothetical protein
LTRQIKEKQLVGGFSPSPLKNDGLRQLGWWNSQLNGKNMFQPPTRESFDILCHYATINNWPWFFGWLDSNRIYSWWVFVALSKSQNIKMHYTTQLVYLNIQHIFTKLYPIVPIVLVVDINIYIYQYIYIIIYIICGKNRLFPGTSVSIYKQLEF